jgi:hypothetical protein
MYTASDGKILMVCSLCSPAENGTIVKIDRVYVSAEIAM